jgi:hypothetical protein
MIACNMGIDSIVEADDGNCYKININFVDLHLVETVKNNIANNIKITKAE